MRIKQGIHAVATNLPPSPSLPAAQEQTHGRPESRHRQRRRGLRRDAYALGEEEGRGRKLLGPAGPRGAFPEAQDPDRGLADPDPGAPTFLCALSCLCVHVLYINTPMYFLALLGVVCAVRVCECFFFSFVRRRALESVAATATKRLAAALTAAAVRMCLPTPFFFLIGCFGDFSASSLRSPTPPSKFFLGHSDHHHTASPPLPPSLCLCCFLVSVFPSGGGALSADLPTLPQHAGRVQLR